MSTVRNFDAVAGALFGTALGDALGAPVEFLRYKTIIERHGRFGPADLPRDARVTDDTQMMLAVARALDASPDLSDIIAFKNALQHQFVVWSTTVEGFRAPGGTCMRVCRRLREHEWSPWWDLTEPWSKGCGANMRVMPIAFADAAWEIRADAARLSAAVTHGHPTALAATELTALAIHLAAQRADLARIPAMMRAYIKTRIDQESRWEDVLSHRTKHRYRTWRRLGWQECGRVLRTLNKALAQPKFTGDPCTLLGGGWIAEEALVLGLYCAIRHDDPVTALRRAARTSGDSDSIAAICGAITGAYHGLAAWPAAWIDRIEYRDQLMAHAVALSRP